MINCQRLYYFQLIYIRHDFSSQELQSVLILFKSKLRKQFFSDEQYASPYNPPVYSTLSFMQINKP